MLKSTISAGVLLFSAIAANYANATEFKEGHHYDTYASSTLTSKPTFIEYISFFCPACENLNTFQDEIYRAVPKGVIKRRVSVDIIKKTTPAGFFALSKAMAVSDELYDQIGNSIVDLIFVAIHKEGAIITPSLVEKLILAVDQKYDANILELYNDEKAAEVAKFTLANQRLVSSRGMLNSVPRIIINGRHVVKFDALDKKNFFKELHELTKYLVNEDYGHEKANN